VTPRKFAVNHLDQLADGRTDVPSCREITGPDQSALTDDDDRSAGTAARLRRRVEQIFATEQGSIRRR
jgi:hypothetical protein